MEENMLCEIASINTDGQFYCTRDPGHEGPCAAVPATSLQKLIQNYGPEEIPVEFFSVLENALVEELNLAFKEMANTNAMQEDVRVFQEACGQGTREELLTEGLNSDNLVKLYKKLVDEEYQELITAFDRDDVVGIADGAADLIWVILGMCNAAGINIAPVWAEVTSSNMSKTVDGKVIRREDGKILKPETYFPPNIRKALNLDAE